MPTLFENPFAQYTSDAGEILAGGSLEFLDSLTSLAKDVYADRALGTSLGNTVELDAGGRSPTAIWGDGQYNVRLLDSDDVQVGLVEEWGQSVDGDVPLDPADGDEDDVYRTDGTDAYWGPVREVPDPTGHSGKYVGTDGELVQWTAFPEAEVYDDENLPGGIEQGAASIQVGKQLRQCGSGTIASTGALTGNVAITFATPFASLLHVNFTITGSGGSTPQGAKPGLSYVGSPTGMTVYAYAADEHDVPGWLLTAATNFTYEAIGLVA